MEYCKINGLDMFVEREPSKGIEIIGEKERAFAGNLKVISTVKKQDWNFGTGPFLIQDALFLQQLIEGNGDYWSFDDSDWDNLYSSKGQLATPQDDVPTVVTGKFGQAIGAQSDMIFPVPFACNNYTVGIYKKNATWQHIFKNTKGEVWTDGVAGGTAAWLTLGAEDVTVDAGCTVDDLVIILEVFDLQSDIPAQWVAYDSPFSPLPYLFIEGEIIYGGSKVLCKGEVRSVAQIDEETGILQCALEEV